MSDLLGVTVEDLMASLRARDTRFPSETGTFLAYQVAEALLDNPSAPRASDVRVAEDGTVGVFAPPRSATEEQAAQAVVELLRGLQALTGKAPPRSLEALMERGPSSGRWDLPSLRNDLEASLVPLNRGASRRVLARLVREARRQPSRPAPRPVDQELDALLDAPTNPPAPPRRSDRAPVVSAPSARPQRPAPPPRDPEARVAARAPSSWEPPASPPPKPTPPVASPTVASSPPWEQPASPPRDPAPSASVPAPLVDGPSTAPPRRPRPQPRPRPSAPAEPDWSSAPPPEPPGGEPAPPVAAPRRPAGALPPSPEPVGASTRVGFPDGPELDPEDATLFDGGAAPPVAMDDLPPLYDDGAADDDATLWDDSPPVAAPPEPTPAPAPYAPTPAPAPRAPVAPEPRAPYAERRRVDPEATATGDALEQLGAELEPSGGPSPLGWVLAFVAIIAVTAATVAVLRPDLVDQLLGRPVAEAPAAPDPAEQEARRAEELGRYGVLTVRARPEQTQVLMFVGRGPAVADQLPTGVAHEFVILADGRRPSRAVVPPDATWEDTDDGPRYELAMQAGPALEPGARLDLGETELPRDVGHRASLGSVRVITNPPAAKVYLLIGFAPEARVENIPTDEVVELVAFRPGYRIERVVVGPSDWTPTERGVKAASVEVTLTSLEDVDRLGLPPR